MDPGSGDRIKRGDCGAMTRISTLLLGTAALALLAGTSQAQIKIGIAGPITGDLAAFGEQLKRGGEMAVADINAAGGINGQKIEVVIADDRCDPKEARSAAEKLANQKVVFVAGHFCSGSSIPASEVYRDEGIIQISPASTNPKFTELGYPNVFRVCGRDDQQGMVAGTYISQHFKGKRVAIVHDKTQYGKGLADETQKSLNKIGVKEVMYEAINPKEKDYSALVSKMKQANVDVIYFGGYHPEAGLIVKQSREQGLAATLMSGDALVDKEFWAIAQKAGEGTLMTFDADPRKDPRSAAVAAKFKAQGYEPEGYTLYTYAAVQIFAQAATKAKSTKEADVLKVLKADSFDTVLGPVKFDAKGDVSNPAYKVYVWKDGQYDYVDGKGQ
jgi:branched-chain amino acid transport system substrate-binding protein